MLGKINAEGGGVKRSCTFAVEVCPIALSLLLLRPLPTYSFEFVIVTTITSITVCSVEMYLTCAAVQDGV